MKSIKPGRGPSMMSGVMSIAVGIFGVIWTIAAASMGGGLFALFGLVFIVVAVVQAVFHFKNATSKNRYSAFDITDGHEEPDPLNQRFGADTRRDAPDTRRDAPGTAAAYCPYCGERAEPDFTFCSRCGKKLP